MGKYDKEIKEAFAKAKKLMSKEQAAECNKIIHVTSAGCAAIAFTPIPIADSIPITALQVNMAFKLGKIFGKEIGSAAAKTMVAAVAAPLIGRMVSKNLLVFVPGFGWAANAAIAAAVTELVGWSLAGTFASDAKRTSEQKDAIIGVSIDDNCPIETNGGMK